MITEVRFSLASYLLTSLKSVALRVGPSAFVSECNK